MFLKRDVNFLELKAILIYHVFEAFIYLSAWAGGKCCLARFWKHVMVVQVLMMAGGVGLLGFGQQQLRDFPGKNLETVFGSGFVLVAVGHGIQMATTLQAFDTDVIRSQKYLNHFFFLLLVTDAGGFIGLTQAEDYGIFLILGGVVAGLQALVVGFFIMDKTDFEFTTYSGILLEFRVYMDSQFQRILSDMNQNIDSQKEGQKERKLRTIKELLMKRRKVMAMQQGQKEHLLDNVVAKYGLQLVNDLKLKGRLNLMLCFLPLVWIGIELQYSFWMMSVYRMDRMSFLNPPQLILGLNLIVAAFFIPLFTVLINSFLVAAGYFRGMHRMLIGGFFVVLSVLMALNNINAQELRNEKANEPYFDQVKLVMINGINCNLSFNEKIFVDYQQTHGLKTSVPIFKYSSMPEIRRFRARSNSHSKMASIDDYYESYDVDAFVFEWEWSTFFDMATYYVKPGSVGQMLTVFPYDCKEHNPFDFLLDTRASKGLKGSSQYDIIFIAPPDPSVPRVLRVHHQRDVHSKPGLRFLIANDTIVHNFQVYRGDKLLFEFPKLEGLDTKFYWL